MAQQAGTQHWANTNRLLTPSTSPSTRLLDPTGVGLLLGQLQITPTHKETGFCLLNWQRLYQLEKQLFRNQPSELMDLAANALNPDELLSQIDGLLTRAATVYFPLHDDVADSIIIEPEIAWPLWYAPIMPMGVQYGDPDELFYDGVLSNRGVEDFLMCLAAADMMQGWDDDTINDVTQRQRAMYPIWQTPNNFCLSDLVPNLLKQPPAPPFDDLAAVCLTVLHATNTCWLDISYDDYIESGYGDTQWHDVQEVAALRSQWQDAQPFLEAGRRLSTVCDVADSGLRDRRFRALCQLLNDRWTMHIGQLTLPIFTNLEVS